MMLSLNNFLEILCLPGIPDSSVHITKGQNGAIDCMYGILPCGSSIEIPVIAGQPVLIDFSSSVISLDGLRNTAGDSVIHRERSKIWRIARTLLTGSNRITRENADRFLELVQSKQGAMPKILVIGGGEVGSGAQALYSSQNVGVLGLDVYASPYTQIVADGHKIPLKNESVDGIWIQAVLEHVLEPAIVVQEMWRVLKNGGVIYAETPFMQQVHEGAYDFTRFTESGHRWLFRNFRLIDSGPVLGLGTSVFWSLKYLFAGILRNRKLGLAAALPFFWLHYLDALAPKAFTSDGASGLYFLGCKDEEMIMPEDIIKFYRGAFV